MTAASLLTTLLLALAIAIAAKPVLEQKPPMKLHLTKRHNLSNYNIVESDRRRLNILRRRAGDQDDSDSNLNSTASNIIPAVFGAVQYTVSIGVGTPATNYQLSIDSGSSNTWVGGNRAYKQTCSSHNTGNSVRISYGGGTSGLRGNEFIDRVTIGSLVINNQSIGVDSQSHVFHDGASDGILGIGPVGLTSGTLFDGDKMIAGTIPTVTDSLFAGGQIPKNLVAVYFEPGNKTNLTIGEVSFGAVDTSKVVGDITYAPITTHSRAGKYWGVDMSLSYGQGSKRSNLAGISNGTCVIDTGTTQVLLATDAYNAYQASTGAVSDEPTGLLSITATQFNNLQNLIFTISGVDFALTPDAQILSRSLNTLLGGIQQNYYLLIGDLGPNISGMNALVGLAFLERFLSVYDTDNRRVGLAQTSFTNAIFNSKSPDDNNN